MTRYLKAIVPLFTGAAAAFAAFAEDNVWDATEWGIIGAAITTAFGVWATPNLPPAPRG